MIALFSLWHNYTFSKDALYSCKEDILRHNARSLLIISAVVVILILLFAGISITFEKKISKFLISLGASVLEFGVFLYISSLCKHGKYARSRVYAALTVFFICLMGFGMYIGITTRYEYPAVSFLIFLICSQMLFVFDPVWNFLLNIIVVGAFACLSIAIKPAAIWMSEVINAALASFVGMSLSWYLSHVIIKELISSRRLENERNRFREESIRDELTGLSNRRDYLNAVNFYISVCRHVHQTICAIMMDVDYFKKYNDYYGHQKGDTVLQSIGDVLRRLTAEEHVFAARVGGEEFIVLWTENRIAELKRVAIKLRQMIIDLQIPHEKSEAALYVTASFGMYIVRGGSTDTPDDLYSHADRALYEAKRNGRNCIMYIESEDQSLRMVELLPPEKNVGRR